LRGVFASILVKIYLSVVNKYTFIHKLILQNNKKLIISIVFYELEVSD